MSVFRTCALVLVVLAIVLDQSRPIGVQKSKTREKKEDLMTKCERFTENNGLQGTKIKKGADVEDKKTTRIDASKEEENDEDEDDEEDERDSTGGSEKSRRDEKANKGPKIWDQWGKWSPCSVTCGVGKIIRWRHCVGGGCAPGEKEAQIKTCTLPAC